MKHISSELRQLVQERARGCCEYCYIHESDGYLAHEIDHIISKKHRGSTNAANLCLSCFDCNRHKGSDIGSIDLITNNFTGLFNPRLMSWTEHFQLEGPMIVPLTAEGRVTVFLLRLNDEKRLIQRHALLQLGRYPCP